MKVIEKETIEQREKFKVKLNLLYQELLNAEILNELSKNIFLVHDCFKEYSLTLNYTLNAYQTSVILSIFKIYDVDQKSDTITLKYILNSIWSQKYLNNDNKDIKEFAQNGLKKLEEQKEKSKIENLRDKYYAHLDKKYPKGILSFPKEEMITFEEIQTLIRLARQLIQDTYKFVYKEIYNDEKLFKDLAIQIKSITKNIDKGRKNNNQ